MLYPVLKILAVTGIKTFFNSISIENQDYLPKKGPVIFVSNHPNTMMDPLVLGYAIGRKLHFFAKATLFQNAFAKWILPKMRLIPVYRKQDNPNLSSKNVDTFEKGYQIMERGKAFLIFPEGLSTGERILNKIKTGTARIGFGAEEKNNFELNVQILPVGLNYSNIIKFRSDVYVRFGRPIRIKDYRVQWEEDEFEAVNAVTHQIETALSKLTTNIKELDLNEIVSALETIYKKELMLDLGMETESKGDDFSVTKGLINAVEWFVEKRPEKVEEFRKILDRYLNTLERLHIQDEFLQPGNKNLTFLKRAEGILFLIIGFPVYCYGLVNNFLPYKFPRWYVNHYIKLKSEFAPWKMITGAGMFLFYYALGISVVGILTGNAVWTVLYALSLIPSGNFVLVYLRKARDYRQHLHFISVFYRKRNRVYTLIQQRMKIISFLNDAKQEYMAAVGLSG